MPPVWLVHERYLPGSRSHKRSPRLRAEACWAGCARVRPKGGLRSDDAKNGSSSAVAKAHQLEPWRYTGASKAHGALKEGEGGWKRGKREGQGRVEIKRR